MIQKTEAEIMKNWKGDISNPVVSICSITYNHEKYIEEALDSFLMQETDFPFEIVIDDDCSPDGTANIIREYIVKFPTIINANLRDKNVGMALNGIENLKRAKGKYIALCEGDDYWTDSLKLQKQVDFLKSNIKFSGIHNKVLYVDKNNIPTGYSELINEENHNINYIQLTQLYLIHTCSFMFRRDILDKDIFNLLSKAPVGDIVIFIKAGLAGEIKYIDDVMSVYRQGVGVMSTWDRSKSTRTAIEVYTLFEQNKNFTKISKISKISKRFYYYKLSNIYSEEQKFLLSFKYYLLMLYHTMYVFKDNRLVLRKVSFIEYIKTGIRSIPYSIQLIRALKGWQKR